MFEIGEDINSIDPFIWKKPKTRPLNSLSTKSSWGSMPSTSNNWKVIPSTFNKKWVSKKPLNKEKAQAIVDDDKEEIEKIIPKLENSETHKFIGESPFGVFKRVNKENIEKKTAGMDKVKKEEFILNLWSSLSPEEKRKYQNLSKDSNSIFKPSKQTTTHNKIKFGVPSSKKSNKSSSSSSSSKKNTKKTKKNQKKKSSSKSSSSEDSSSESSSYSFSLSSSYSNGYSSSESSSSSSENDYKIIKKKHGRKYVLTNKNTEIVIQFNNKKKRKNLFSNFMFPIPFYSFPQLQ